MAEGWYVDAVTLEHFGTVARLSVLTEFLTRFSPPYWTDAVRSEILAGLQRHEGCAEVLASSTLNAPAVVPMGSMADVFRMQVALGGSGDTGTNHLGEAECIVLADQEHRGVITDDNAAYDLVEPSLSTWCEAPGPT